MRVTVKITTSDYPAERVFHLDDARAEAFAAKVRAEGGTARIVPLAINPALAAMLAKAGVNANSIK